MECAVGGGEDVRVVDEAVCVAGPPVSGRCDEGEIRIVRVGAVEDAQAGF